MTPLINFITHQEVPSLSDWLISYPNIKKIVAVSKTFPLTEIERLYALGYRDFGENKAQELQQKAQVNTLAITWHFIGHIQSNKIKTIVQWADWIHSVDSERLLQLIEQEAIKQNKHIQVLIQLKLTSEDSKHGLDPTEIDMLMQKAQSLTHVKIRGLMVMGPLTDQQAEIEHVFKLASQLFTQLKNTYPECDQLSMGMSQDYELAYTHQSTMFRIGSLLFGRRSP
jgi:PLP dependent protein